MAKKAATKAVVQKKEAKTARKKATAAKTAAEKKPKASPAEKVAKIFNSVNPEEKALFLRHRPIIEAAIKKVGSAVSELRKLYKTAKGDGFEKADFDYARGLETAEAEAKTRARIVRNLTIAKFVGSDLGAQLDMFVEPSRVPAVDRAAEEGQRDSMEGKSAKPSYDPSTEQYRAYMTAYNNDQEKRIKDGIKTLHPAVEADEAKKAETKVITKAQKEADAKAFAEATKAFAEAEAKKAAASRPAPAPVSGVPMTRSEFKRKQDEAKAEAESVFSKKTATTIN